MSGSKSMKLDPFPPVVGTALIDNTPTELYQAIINLVKNYNQNSKNKKNSEPVNSYNKSVSKFIFNTGNPSKSFIKIWICISTHIHIYLHAWGSGSLLVVVQHVCCSILISTHSSIVVQVYMLFKFSTSLFVVVQVYCSQMVLLVWHNKKCSYTFFNVKNL